MCFSVDYEWYAEVSDESTGPAEEPTRCDECGVTVEVGQPIYHLDMRQHEDCQCCGRGECDCPLDAGGDCAGGCRCEEPDYGEQYVYDSCSECRDFLAAVEAAELAAGCRRSEARPPLGQAFEYIGEGGPAEARKYYKAAARLYPGLVASGYLKRAWREMFAPGARP